ncbi:hypothetical protein PCL_05806 [Purpureocillium lilacinum]|uniref:Uncharacterized protein n=1 Tax=Purpureocillium lilacinum TaxID=33203 RepID=A0A2U3EKW4_PURLI|nr:hypothetical protein PCL_05806 [Purpureocillium lilacinum]
MDVWRVKRIKRESTAGADYAKPFAPVPQCVSWSVAAPTMLLGGFSVGSSSLTRLGCRCCVVPRFRVASFPRHGNNRDDSNDSDDSDAGNGSNDTNDSNSLGGTRRTYIATAKTAGAEMVCGPEFADDPCDQPVAPLRTRRNARATIMQGPFLPPTRCILAGEKKHHSPGTHEYRGAVLSQGFNFPSMARQERRWAMPLPDCILQLLCIAL